MSIAEFEVEYAGGPVTVIVDDYEPAEPMRVTGWGFGDAESDWPERLDYRVLDGGEKFEPTYHGREFFEKLIREYLGV